MLKRIAQLETAPQWGVGTAIITLIAAFVMIITGTTLVSVFFVNSPAAIITGWILGALLMVVFVSLTRSRDRDDLRLTAGRTPLPLVVLTAVAFALVVDLLSLALTQVALPPVELFPLSNTANISAVSWLLALILMAAAQPIGEELVFRGVIFPAFRQALGAWSGLFFCALAYGLFHLLAYAPSGGAQPTLLWYGFGVPFLDGLFLSAVRAYTGSTRAAIAAHFAIGALGVLRTLALG